MKDRFYDFGGSIVGFFFLPPTLFRLFEKGAEISLGAQDESIDTLEVFKLYLVVAGILVGPPIHATPDRVPLGIIGRPRRGPNKGHQSINTHVRLL